VWVLYGKTWQLRVSCEFAEQHAVDQQENQRPKYIFICYKKFRHSCGLFDKNENFGESI